MIEKDRVDKKENLSFSELEKSFQAVIGDLVSDRSLDNFRSEYEKLYSALKESHNNNKQLINKLRELNEEVVINSQKISDALYYSKEDSKTIVLLRKEFDRAWRALECYSDRELKNKELMQILKETLSELKEKSESLPDEFAVSEIKEIKDTIAKLKSMPLTDDSNALMEQIKTSETNLDKLNMYVQELHEQDEQMTEECHIFDDRFDKFYADWQSYQGEIKGVKLNNAKLKMDIQENDLKINNVKDKLGVLSARYSINQSEYKSALGDGNRIREKMQNRQTVFNRKLSKSNALLEKRSDLEQNIEKYPLIKQELLTAKANMENENKTMNEELIKIQSKREKIQNEIAAKRNKLKDYHDQFIILSRKFNDYKVVKSSIQNEIKVSEKQVNDDNSAISLEKESLKKTNDAVERAFGDITGYKASLSKDLQYMSLLESEISNLMEKTSSLSTRTLFYMSQKDENEEKFQKLLAQMEGLKEKVDKANTDIQLMNTKKATHKRRIEELKTDDQSLTADIKSMSDQLERLKRSVQEADDKIIEIHKQCCYVERENSKIEKEIESLKIKVIDAKSKNAATKEKLEQAKILVFGGRKSIEETRVVINTIKDGNRHTVNEIQKRVKKAASIRDQITLISRIIEASSSKYDEKVREIEKMKATLNHQIELIRVNYDMKNRRKKQILEVNRLEKVLSLEKAKSSVLVEELSKPAAINTRELLRNIDPEYWSMLDMKQRLLDKINHSIHIMDRLKIKRSIQDKETQKLLNIVENRRTYDIDQKLISEYEHKIRVKQATIDRLNSKTQEKRARVDSALSKISNAKSELSERRQETYDMKVHEPFPEKTRQPAPRHKLMPLLRLTLRSKHPIPLTTRPQILKPIPDPISIRSARL